MQSPFLRGIEAWASVSSSARLHNVWHIKMCSKCIQYTLVLQNTDRLKFSVNIITVHIIFSRPQWDVWMSYKNYSHSLVLYVRLIMVTKLLLVLSLLWWPCCSSPNPKFVWNKRKKRSNSEVSMWLNSTPDAHSVITYFQKIHQQLNFEVQGRSICTIQSFTVLQTPAEFLDYLMISWYLSSHLFQLQQNI